MPRIHVFSGTKAQYVKTAPLLRLMDERGVPYRLIDSGQHAGMGPELRARLGVREPDASLGGTGDVETIPRGLAWSASLLARLGSARRIRETTFGGHDGICVVHGDTVSTVLAALMARRAGLRVAHIEAGLRSHDLLHPFPEEAVRVVVMRMADLLFAPDETAARNLERMGLRGRIVRTSANTVVDALRRALGEDPPPPGSGEVLLSMHRLENLHRRERLLGFVSLAERIARERRVRFVLHGPTRAVLERRGLLERLRGSGVVLGPLLPHDGFAPLLHAAPFVVTDGGSIQEESAVLGVPCLLWRQRTERPDGLGDNVVLSAYDPRVVDAFLADPDAYRRPAGGLDARPSEEILEVLLDETGGIPRG